MAVTCVSAEAEPREANKRVEDATGIRAHGHCRPKSNLASAVGGGLRKRRFPRTRHIDAEPPGGRRIRLVATENARVLIVRRIVSMCVNRCRARLQPHARST